MSKFCTSCGSPLQDGDLICQNCGASAMEAPAAQPAPMTVPYTPPQTATLNGETNNETVSLWAYLGMIVLFLLPCVGFIAAIVMSFVPKNKNIKNFARAAVIWMVVLALLSFIAGLLISAVVAEAVAAVVAGIGDFAEDNGAISENGESLDLNALFDAIQKELENEGVTVNGSIHITDGDDTVDIGGSVDVSGADAVSEVSIAA